MDPTPITAAFLDELVERTDAAGGIGSEGAAAVWSEMHGVVAPDDLARFDGVDPFGDAYGDLQLELWSRWSGREYDPTSTELTHFDLEAHATSRTAYGPGAPALVLAHHHLAVARAVGALGIDGGRVLELGAGWGFQAEALSELGFEVDVVDVNPRFLELVARRLAARGFGGRQLVGTFDDFTTPTGGYDLAYTYEALHHTPTPAATIRRLVDPGGTAARCVAFVGEPVVDMWPSWGLRTDQESLYCIRKFGWFESGWTDVFILSCIARVGLGAHLLRPSASERDGAVLGAPVRRLDPADRTTWTPFVAGWDRHGEGLTSLGESSLAFGVDDATTGVVLELGWHNPRPSTLEITVLCGDRVDRVRTELLLGVSELLVPLPTGTDRAVTLVLEGETWCPRAVVETPDRRRISVVVGAVRPVHGRRAGHPGADGRAVPLVRGVRAEAKRRVRRALYGRP